MFTTKNIFNRNYLMWCFTCNSSTD